MSPMMLARCVKRATRLPVAGCVLVLSMVVCGGRVACAATTWQDRTQEHVAGSEPSAFAQSTTNANFYVATNGRDSWSGKLPAPNLQHTDGPFASLARAQIAVESLLKGQPIFPIVVMVRQGTYYLPLSPTNPGTLNFTSSDSGTATVPVIWENYPAESPVVSGGVPVTGWTQVSGALWRARLPANTPPFEYLFYNGVRRLRSRLQSASGGTGST